MRRVNVMSAPRGDGQLRLLADRIAVRWLVTELADLGGVLDALTPGGVATLDLSGHSSMDAHHQLLLGCTLVTAADPAVTGFFRERRDQLHALGIAAVRLLGCCTAGPAGAQRTITVLGALLGLPVFGAITAVGHRDYDAGGFSPAYDLYLRDQDHLEVFGACPVCPIPLSCGADVRADAIRSPHHEAL